jgi:hypothetical protein
MCAGRHEHCFLPFGGVKGGSGGGDSGTGCCNVQPQKMEPVRVVVKEGESRRDVEEGERERGG